MDYEPAPSLAKEWSPATPGAHERSAAGVPAGQVASLIEALQSHGICATLSCRGAQFLASGVTARVAMGSLAECRGDARAPAAAGTMRPERGLSVVYSALRAAIPVTVTVIDPAGQASQDNLQQFRLSFCSFLSDANIDRRLLGICLAASELPSPQFRSELRPSLGDGPRYVMLHDPTETRPRRTVSGENIWQLLRSEEKGLPRFWPAFAAGVRSQCPLLASESSSVVQPGSGLVTPPDSAWLPLTVDLCDFANANGTLDDVRLDRALDASVELGDRLHDCLSWFDDRQRSDAARNRRLAIRIEGIADLAVKSGLRPDDWGSLQRLDRLLMRVRRRLWAASRRLALSRGPLPALLEQEPQPGANDGERRRDWQRRWQSALASAQVRNRNLLALSPNALLPRGRKASPAFADLLPLLAHADALYFANPPSLAHWNSIDFRGFHRRVGAQVRAHNAASFIAAGV